MHRFFVAVCASRLHTFLRRGIGLALVGVCVCAQAEQSVAMDKFLTLGTSPLAGPYFSMGSTLCKLANRERQKTLIRCLAQPSPGSEYNTRAVAVEEFELGMSRSGVLDDEYGNRTVNDDIEGDVLRSVMSLNPIPIMMIAKRTSGLRDIAELRGKKLNLGIPGSGERNLIEGLLRAKQISKAELAGTAEYGASKVVDAFCRNDVDVIVSAFGNPSAENRRMLDECDGEITPLSVSTRALLMKESPTLQEMAIPGGVYERHPESVQTLGSYVVLFTNKHVSAESIKRFVASVVKHLPDLKASDPRLGALSIESMFKQGITVPLHDGVVQYLATRPFPVMSVNAPQTKP